MSNTPTPLQEKVAAQLDLAFIELAISHEVRRQGLAAAPGDELVQALIKCRKLLERCEGCMRMKGGG